MPNDAKAFAYDWVAQAIKVVLRGTLTDGEVVAEIEKIRAAMERAAKARRES